MYDCLCVFVCSVVFLLFFAFVCLCIILIVCVALCRAVLIDYLFVCVWLLV